MEAWVQCRSDKHVTRMVSLLGLAPLKGKKVGLTLPESPQERFIPLTTLRWVALRSGARRSRLSATLEFNDPVAWMSLDGEKTPVLLKKLRGMEHLWVDSLGILRDWATLLAAFPEAKKAPDPWREVQLRLQFIRSGLVQFDRQLREMT